ncbi:MAG: helix-hairpin-helix domain-containing protein [Verrucomicrobiae bacterium]|nr:helix-hairpin-helix domain-containing protein [Verrucomicrobiae bacterium]NNJ87083.1 hypothetical protein [Akkermansiaceae bacterium]
MPHTLLLRLRKSLLLTMTACMLPCGIAQSAPLVKIENCTLIKTDWADGDSFRIKIPFKPADRNGPGHKAREITIRLYGADCIESKIHDTTEGRRLRAQRRYFGITEVGGNAQASIDLALKYGNLATEETRKILAQPFTVHTAFADGRGDPNFKRYYAFVTTADGNDLASQLVSMGLARAYGVYRETPDKQHRNDYRDRLADLELQAAKNGKGVWQHTDWEKLPQERQAQRREEREIELAMENKKPGPVGKIHINKASRDDLTRLPGIGETKANEIIGNRPYRKPADLLKVPGIGPKTLEKLKPYLIFPAASE